jgi:hypothetical protein
MYISYQVFGKEVSRNAAGQGNQAIKQASKKIALEKLMATQDSHFSGV